MACCYVDGVQRVLGASLKPTGELRWYGMVGARSLPAGRYALSVAAVDPAGNRVAACRGRARADPLRRARPARAIRVKAGSLVRVRVLTDAAPGQWRLGRPHRRREAAGLPDPGAAAQRPLPPVRHRERSRVGGSRGRDRRMTRRSWIAVALVGAFVLAAAAASRAGGTTSRRRRRRSSAPRRSSSCRARSRRRSPARRRSSTRCRGRRSATTTSGRTSHRSTTGRRTGSSGACGRAGSSSSRPPSGTARCSSAS